jgi:CheY-like chemotaxis protein
MCGCRNNADGRALLAEVLELPGHQVLTAASAYDALRLAREEMPEAFVIDIGIPGMDG